VVKELYYFIKHHLLLRVEVRVDLYKTTIDFIKKGFTIGQA